jgi:CHAD domain-containing protein
LEVSESAEVGIKRIVDEQLENALDELRGADAKKADAAVHAARKRLKRIRAIIRLVREELGEETFSHENACFRDAGGTLSEARDAAVLVQTLDSLKETVDQPAFASARKKLVARRLAVKKRVLDAGNGLESVAELVEAARKRVGEWRIERDGWEALRPGLKRIYGEARTAFECAEVGGAPELFHEWRKRVKDLWHQAEILEGIWPAVMKELAEQFHALADLLGDEHDLSVLKAVVEAEALARAGGVSPVAAAAAERRTRLQEEARALGGRLFAEKAGAFAKRLGEYWLAWKREGALGVKEEGEIELQPAKEGEAADDAVRAVAEADEGGDSVEGGGDTSELGTPPAA